MKNKMDSNLRQVDSDSDSRCPDSHITDSNIIFFLSLNKTKVIVCGVNIMSNILVLNFMRLCLIVSF